MNQNDVATYQVMSALAVVTLAFKYTLETYAKEAGAAKIDDVAAVLRASIKNAIPTPNVPDSVYAATVANNLAAFDEMVKEVRGAVGPAQ